jgi:hypothetical protein
MQPSAEPSTIGQSFGDAEVADGSFLFQGNVNNGDVYINRVSPLKLFAIICDSQIGFDQR